LFYDIHIFGVKLLSVSGLPTAKLGGKDKHFSVNDNAHTYFIKIL